MKRYRLALLGFVAVVSVSRLADANGFLLYEVSPRALGQGEAVVADGSAPSTVFYNPAGMTRLEGLQLEGSAYLYVAKNGFTPESTGVREAAKTAVYPMPSGFITYKPLSWLAAGIGGYTAYGLGVEWNKGWTGAHLVEKSELMSYTVQPSLAVGPWKGVSIGAGVDFLFGSLEMSRALPLGGNNPPGTLRLGGTAGGVGANFGILYEAAPWLRFGAIYRTPIVIRANEGKADFTVPAEFERDMQDQRFSTRIKLPAVFSFGVRFIPMKDLEIEADAGAVLWSSYDQLTFEFQKNPGLSQPQVKNWKTAMQLRFGGHYHLGKASIRAGFIFDQNPIPNSTLDPSVPDSDRLDPTIGAGYDFGKVRIDAAYMVDFVLKRKVSASENPFPGTYDAFVHIVSIGASAKL